VFYFWVILDISVSNVFRIKSTFCEHLLIVRRWKKPDWNHKNNARLFWFGFTVRLSSYPSALLHVVSITNFFFASKISCSVFETGISFRFVVPAFESFSASFSPVCRPLIYEQVRELGVKLRHVVHEDWLVSSLSLHVPNMVLAKMNNFEHRSKPIYASYTFQVLMSFWLSQTNISNGVEEWRLQKPWPNP